jgi:hypothetical protein
LFVTIYVYIIYIFLIISCAGTAPQAWSHRV